MTNHNPSQKRKLNGIRGRLALGLAVPSVLVLCISAQAQTSKLPMAKKSIFGTTKAATPSKTISRVDSGRTTRGKGISESKTPSVTGMRTSRSSSSGFLGRPTTRLGITTLPKTTSRSSNIPRVNSSGNRHVGRASNQGLTDRVIDLNVGNRGIVSGNPRGTSRLPGITSGLGQGISRPPVAGGQLDRTVTRPSVPGLQPSRPSIQPHVSGPMRTLPFDLTNRIPATPKPDGGKIDRVLPGGNAGILDVKPGELPRITESNRSFEDILGRVSKIETKPLDIKDFRKELPKLKLLDEGNGKPELKLEQQKIVAGARKTMLHRFGVGARCHWWADLLCGWHWHRYGCHWTDLCVVPGYWSCWTPCHYRVVWCPTVYGHARSAWYFGIESFLIPDVHALGVHQVSPYSPAAMAGLQAGDMILSVNGYAFDNDAVLPEMIQTSGGILNLEVYREGMEAPMTVQVRLRRLRVTSY